MERIFFPLACFALFLIGVLLFALPAKSQGVQQAIVCDTADQIEAVYGLMIRDKQEPPEAIQLVNDAAGNASACGVLILTAEPLEVIRTLEIGDYNLFILKIVVTAVGSPMGLMPAHMEQFVMVLGEKKARLDM